MKRSEIWQANLAPYVGNRLAARLIQALKGSRLFLYRLQCGIRFDLRVWGPRRGLATYLGYYPDGLTYSAELRSLYRKWIRGNRTNNNGDAARFIAFILNLRQILAEGIDGDFAELGVWKGNSAALLAHFASGAKRRVFLFDTFSGFDQRDMVGLDQGKPLEFAKTSVEFVRNTVGHPELTTYLQGYFPGTINDEVRRATFALVHLDCDLYEPMKAALEFFYSRMPNGGLLILHDYSSGAWNGAKVAIDEFCRSTGEHVNLWPDKSGTATIRKSQKWCRNA